MIFRYPASTFSCVLIFSILITISSSSAQDDEYLDCSRQIECGDLRFGFPFRGPGRPSYCGLPEFNLTCRNRIPTISISGLSYRILEINNSSQILTLLQTDFDQNLCPSNPRNVTGVENLFNFTVETQFVDLYYGCSLPTSGILIPLDLGSFSCPNNRSQGGDFLPTESVLGRYEAAIRGWLAQCSKKVRVPVKLTAMESLQRDPTGARLTETIDGGFGMQWTSNDSLCSTCRFSDVSNRRRLYSIIFPILGGVLIILIISLAIRRWMKRKVRKDAKKKNRVKEFLINTTEFGEDDKKDIDVPFFDLECILSATDFFCHNNKLGQGGFGPVYKGMFPGGQEIAVKRLSSGSTQGLEEFKNEVVLIAKLQHRNLVRLLGFCVEGSEKMLLYEYMPNKSLDSFIFNRSRSVLLNWEVRFNIIMGIARGMLYLHRDSRLTIVHRDLKTSNVLLDEEMNPKISDFGMARIVAAKQTEVDTVRVVGTYGYMSPEYALDGKFSTKSDVFSFGIVVLEILIGRKNTGFYKYEEGISLSSHVWGKWREGNVMEVMEQSLPGTCNANEFMRCVIVALLCVQEDPSDRPTMADVVFMLGCDPSSLPHPKEPAFSVRNHAATAPSTSVGTMEITTELQGR